MEFGKINEGLDAEKYGKIIPPRSFMQKTFDEQKDNWFKELQRTILAQRDKLDTKAALQRLGVIAQNNIRATIDWWAAEGEPRNGPKVIALKGFDSPLIWSGKMRQSVNFVVDEDPSGGDE